MPNYILADANIIDVKNGSTFKGSIEIDNHQIKHIYNKDARIREGVEVINMHGKYIIPGLIDMHCHIKDALAPHFVASGVTTIRNTAGSLIELKRMIDLPPDSLTPRIYSTDRMIDGPPGLWGPTSFGNFVTDDPAEARDEVRRQVEIGVKFIKVYGWLSRRVMEAVVEEAKKYNLEVSCDLLHSQDVHALEAAKMGVTWFEHASGFAQVLNPNWFPLAKQEDIENVDWQNPDKRTIRALCQDMLQYNVKLCPTIVLSDQIEQLPQHWNPDNDVSKTVYQSGGLAGHWAHIANHSEGLKKQIGILNAFTKMVAKSYFDQGGTVVAGTDTPAGVWTYPGMALHRELEILVEIGFTEMEALQAATYNAARSIHLENVGMIKTNAMADLVILDSDPLMDIRNTRDIYRVVKGGRMITQSDILTEIPSEEWLERRYQTLQEKYDAFLGTEQ